MNKAILITGGTGFLGSEIVAKLVACRAEKIYVLVRANGQEAAVHRLKAAWFAYKDLYERIGVQVVPVTGDFTLPGLGLKAEDLQTLEREVGMIFHVGAEVGLQKNQAELELVNREGTRNMLEFAQGIPELERFLYVSTAYVAGRKKGRILEDEISDSASSSFPADEITDSTSTISQSDAYSSFYEKSKAEAEALVRASSLPWSVCRPGMIVGHSQTGRVKNFNTIYYVLKQMLTGKMPVLPVGKELGLNLVPVDYVADAAVQIAFNDEARGKVFHLTCPASMQPRAGELVDYVRSWSKKHLDLELAKPLYVAMPGLKQLGLSYNQKGQRTKKNQLTNLLTLLPYFYGEQEFDRSNTDALIGPYKLDWRDYIDALLEYACRKNFMQQTERTVFEQAEVRRASKHYPMHYYDVTASGIKEVSGEVVNKRVEIIRAALVAWGIRKGDKIALTGINCVDYMMLDQAIGLIGAVSVPIYYTTPAEEVELLLNRSGARWFFVGDERILKGLEELEENRKNTLLGKVQLVIFSQALKTFDKNHASVSGEMHINGGRISSDQYMDYRSFLMKGRQAGSLPELTAPDPEDLATIRYTSGTTGEPKGVMFNYQQLAWMGEVLTNLLSWKGRNREMRYLSFLPESHVVEGILASYAPYYMLARVDFYFLNDFGALVDTLPKVRPTVFFSVPRFYEKLWDQLAANKIGQKYLTMKEGPARRATAALLKKVILKKAGLDACEQLIVGSAPISQALLENFRALGIEIHNAYGQTEAPLITINRLGDNVIPTIGTPLPETEVWLESDGELMVRGPQVCLGYYGLDTDTVQDGILKTGDLGSVDENGHITLFGRKKEMVITAYGKNISIPKIEEKLKNISGVSEAVLIGENRPYCTALLWLEGEVSDLDAQIAAVNQELSHPEQVRKYRVIAEPLSIAKGELTPNLKVKRANVEAHYQDIIKELYECK